MIISVTVPGVPVVKQLAFRVSGSLRQVTELSPIIQVPLIVTRSWFLFDVVNADTKADTAIRPKPTIENFFIN